jgi:hypothetical protein
VVVVRQTVDHRHLHASSSSSSSSRANGSRASSSREGVGSTRHCCLRASCGW